MVGKRDEESGEVVGLEGEIDMEQSVEALAEEAGADEEHDGDGEFEDDEVRAETAPESSGGAAVAVVESFAHGGRRETEDRGEREDRRCEQSDDGGEAEDVWVESKTGEVGHAGEHVFRDEAEQELHGEVTGGETSDSSGGDEHEAFGDELANEARGRGAECAADGELATAAFGADQQQAGNVDAGDHEQQAGSGEKDEQDGTDVCRR